MAQFIVGDQVTCKVDSTNAFTDADYASDDGLVAYLTDSDNATGPVPTVLKTPASPGSPGTETHEPYGVLANRIDALGDPTGVSGNELTYTSGANVQVSGIAAVTIPTGITVDGTSIGRGLGLVLTNPSAATDGLQPVATGGKGRIVARNGNVVYWDIRGK